MIIPLKKIQIESVPSFLKVVKADLDQGLMVDRKIGPKAIGCECNFFHHQTITICGQSNTFIITHIYCTIH